MRFAPPFRSSQAPKIRLDREVRCASFNGEFSCDIASRTTAAKRPGPTLYKGSRRMHLAHCGMGKKGVKQSSDRRLRFRRCALGIGIVTTVDITVRDGERAYRTESRIAAHHHHVGIHLGKLTMRVVSQGSGLGGLAFGALTRMGLTDSVLSEMCVGHRS